MPQRPAVARCWISEPAAALLERGGMVRPVVLPRRARGISWEQAVAPYGGGLLPAITTDTVSIW